MLDRFQRTTLMGAIAIIVAGTVFVALSPHTHTGCVSGTVNDPTLNARGPWASLGTDGKWFVPSWTAVEVQRSDPVDAVQGCIARELWAHRELTSARLDDTCRDGWQDAALDDVVYRKCRGFRYGDK